MEDVNKGKFDFIDVEIGGGQLQRMAIISQHRKKRNTQYHAYMLFTK